MLSSLGNCHYCARPRPFPLKNLCPIPMLALLVLFTEPSSCQCRAAEATSRTAALTPPAVASTIRHRAWHVSETENFQVCSLRGAAEAQRIAAACEQLRQRIAALCGIAAKPWMPRCQVVLHRDSAAYLAVVGDAGKNTVASALTRRAVDRIRLRQIDVRGDVDDFLSTALPHELCHVLLADRFAEVPLWCDEGLAILLDPLDKQQLHQRDLQVAVDQGEIMPLNQLLDLRHYPRADQWPIFYGQSASLVRHLLQQGSPPQLLKFVDLQRSHGANIALRDVYGINGLAELQRQWHVPTTGSTSVPLALLPFAELATPLAPLAETP